jgi:hypothetical protein
MWWRLRRRVTMADHLATVSQTPKPWQDGQQMREWIRDQKIIAGNSLLPTIEACQELADVTGGLQMIVENRRGSWRAYEARRRRCLEAVRALLNDLPGWENEIRTSIEQHSEIGRLDMITKMQSLDLAALRSLNDALGIANARPLLLVSPSFFTEKVDRWHDFAETLAEAFRQAVRSTNPSLPLQPSNTGPVVRFLIAAIPHITGETPTTAAVARYLQRANR